jgi:putative ABC transport system ATP-binding protein
MSNNNDRLIQLQEVAKIFLTDEIETHAFSGITPDLDDEEYVSIAGLSGCGKSTLLSILGLLDTPSDGAYILNGRPVEYLKRKERARIRNREISFIFRSFNRIGDLAVYENVELPLAFRGMGAKERKSRVNESLERVGMAHRAKHLPSHLSCSQQQRVVVARALRGNPLILLARLSIGLNTREFVISTFPYQDYISYKKENPVLLDILAYTAGDNFSLHAGEDAAYLEGSYVAGNLFSLFGVQAERGRVLRPEADRIENGSPAVVISQRF